jgi:hypothetical protein
MAEIVIQTSQRSSTLTCVTSAPGTTHVKPGGNSMKRRQTTNVGHEVQLSVTVALQPHDLLSQFPYPRKFSLEIPKREIANFLETKDIYDKTHRLYIDASRFYTY